MTAWRHKRKQKRLILWFVVHGLALNVVPTIGGTSERLVTDRLSGLAISGFDPVAYFTDAAAREGRDDIELSEGGAVWRFRNVGNREGFAARPDIYSPKFGGHDPIDVARGVPRPGRPQIWLIVERQLYLFGDEANRDTFKAAVAASQKAARDAWPAVESQLAR